MSYRAQAETDGRQRFTMLEIDLPFCSLTYGQAPCTARLASGKQKCFNTRNVGADCQDPEHFTPATLTYRFSTAAANLPKLDLLPCLVSWSVTPTTINPRGGLGVRSSLSVTLADFAHHDRGFDKYVGERQYDPVQTGSFFGRFRARNPYYWGAPVRLIQGFIDADGNYDPADTLTRHFIMTDFAGPDATGSVRITCKDPIKQVDDDRAKFPVVSQGKTAAQLDKSAPSVTLIPDGIGGTYPASGKVRIEDEICAFTRSGDALTLTRAQSHTEAEDHDAEALCQVVGIIDPAPADQIVHDLLTARGIDPSCIPLGDWQQERADWFQFVYATEVASPTGVNKLVNELGKQAGFFLWWDDVARLIRMQAVRSVPPTAAVLDDDHLVAGSFAASDQEDKRISQSWTYHGMINPVEPLEDPKNYTAVDALIDANLYHSDKIETTFSRWLTTYATAAARSINQRLLQRFGHTPKKFSFALDLKDSELWTGGLAKIESRHLQGPTGRPQRTPIQVLRVLDQGRNTLAYEALEYNVPPPEDDEPSIPTIIIANDAIDLNVRYLYETQIGAVTDEPVEVNLVIEDTANVTGLDGGGFPDGSMIYLDLYGNLSGSIGIAGRGGYALLELTGLKQKPWFRAEADDGQDGTDGGDAIIMREDWTIRRHGPALISGGAGGSGGGGGTVNALVAYISGGGGAGAARTIFGATAGGAGGSATDNDNVGHADFGEDGTDGGVSGHGIGGIGGNQSTEFPAGNGGDGVGRAQDGKPGTDGVMYTELSTAQYPTKGGAAGKAGALVRTNGHELTFTEGNDPDYVFGEIR